jgi:hypothetical protein
MHTFAKLTTLTLAAIVLSSNLAVAASIFDSQSRDETPHDVFNDVIDSIGERDVEIEIRHSEMVDADIDGLSHLVDPHVITHPGVNDAVLNPKQLKLALRQGLLLLSCSAGGDDLRVANAGNIDLPAGTRLAWKVKATGDKGVARLTSGLEAGESIRIADVLDANVAKGTGCSAKVKGL